MRTSVNFNHLECFLCVAQELSFSRSAEKLSIAQSAVSKQIQMLEDDLGAQLFIRAKKKVLLTKAGQRLYESVAPIFQELVHRVSSFESSRTELSGVIEFGCLSEVGSLVLLPLVSKYHSQNPQVIVKVSFLKAYEIIEGVKSAELDFGLVPGEHDEALLSPKLAVEHALWEDIVLLSSPKTKKLFSKKKTPLAQLPYVSYRDNDPLLNLFLSRFAPRTQRAKLDIRMTVNSHKSMVALLEEHPYFAVMPYLSARKEIEEKKLCVFSPQRIKESLSLIYMDTGYPRALNSQFKKYLLGQLNRLYASPT